MRGRGGVGRARGSEPSSGGGGRVWYEQIKTGNGVFPTNNREQFTLIFHSLPKGSRELVCC